jgi:hypothetical protein
MWPLWLQRLELMLNRVYLLLLLKQDSHDLNLKCPWP